MTAALNEWLSPEIEWESHVWEIRGYKVGFLLETRRPAMKKINTMPIRRVRKLQGQQLTVGLDLGDRSGFCCVLNEGGEVMVEERAEN